MGFESFLVWLEVNPQHADSIKNMGVSLFEELGAEYVFEYWIILCNKILQFRMQPSHIWKFLNFHIKILFSQPQKAKDLFKFDADFKKPWVNHFNERKNKGSPGGRTS